MEKAGNGWGPPQNVGAPVNSPGQEWYPTIAQDGTMYFGSDREGGKGRTDIYRSRLVDGKYTEPENLGDAINTQFEEFEPYISPSISGTSATAPGPRPQTSATRSIRVVLNIHR
jgi:hypothetical protein